MELLKGIQPIYKEKTSPSQYLILLSSLFLLYWYWPEKEAKKNLIAMGPNNIKSHWSLGKVEDIFCLNKICWSEHAAIGRSMVRNSNSFTIFENVDIVRLGLADVKLNCFWFI